MLWGAYYAVLLMVEKLGLLRVLAACPACSSMRMRCFFIVGWALFACTEPGQRCPGYLALVRGCPVCRCTMPLRFNCSKSNVAVVAAFGLCQRVAQGCASVRH